jgi:hypothetical protein
MSVLTIGKGIGRKIELVRAAKLPAPTQFFENSPISSLDCGDIREDYTQDVKRLESPLPFFAAQ